MDPIDAQQIQELETMRSMWKLAVWFIGVSWPILSALIIYFYTKYNTLMEANLNKLEKENEILKAKQ